MSGRDCGSVPPPFSCTSEWCLTVWLGPALAVGVCEPPVVIVTVAGKLFTVPSFTTNWAT